LDAVVRDGRPVVEAEQPPTLTGVEVGFGLRVHDDLEVVDVVPRRPELLPARTPVLPEEDPGPVVRVRVDRPERDLLVLDVVERLRRALLPLAEFCARAPADVLLPRVPHPE